MQETFSRHFTLSACICVLAIAMAAVSFAHESLNLCLDPVCPIGELGNEPGGLRQSWEYTAAMMLSSGKLFHQRWWLSAATGNDYHEITVDDGGREVGRLPYAKSHHGLFQVVAMPEFTHLLGPVVDASHMKPRARIARHTSIVNQLIDQLPPHHYFMQVLDSTAVDLAAFHNRGFQVTPQFTFKIDCRRDLDVVWSDMRDKTRNVIRRAKEKYTIAPESDPENFIRFYCDNLLRRNLKNAFDFTNFRSLLSECTRRRSGELLAACRADGTPVAMVLLVWDDDTMYYLMSSRAPDLADNGAISLLLWQGMQRANQMQLTFDLDGVTSAGTWQFLNGFGGHLSTRFVVSRSTRRYAFYRTVRDTIKKAYARA